MMPVTDHAVSHLEIGHALADLHDDAGVAVPQRHRFVEFGENRFQRRQQAVRLDLVQDLSHALGVLSSLRDQARLAELDDHPFGAS